MSEQKKARNEKKKEGRGKSKEEGTNQDAQPAAPRMAKKLKAQSLSEGERLTYKCEAKGNPQPEYKWFKDSTPLKKSKEIRIRNGRKNSRLQISKVKMSDAGEYRCEASNFLGKAEVKGSVTVSKKATTTPSTPGSGHKRACNETERGYCVNGGRCFVVEGTDIYTFSCV